MGREWNTKREEKWRRRKKVAYFWKRGEEEENRDNLKAIIDTGYRASTCGEL